jgi:hypothetical protein
MLSSAFKGLTRPVMAVAVALVMVFAGASAASAGTISLSQTLFTTWPASVTITGTGFPASTIVRVGLCSERTYGAFGVPACSTFTDATTDVNGDFSVSITVTLTNTNIHATVVPPPINAGQPRTFTCANVGGDQCAVWAVEHRTTTLYDRENILFL